MGEKTGISWCDHTFNPWWGCTKVSAGCANCYAETLSDRFAKGYWGPGPRRTFGDKHWNEPLRWARKAKREGVRRRVFCGSMCDVFEIHLDEDVAGELYAARRKLWRMILRTPELDWLLLTKRPENAEQVLPLHWLELGGWPSNVWLGTSVEDQATADERIPKLLALPASVRFLSVEPLLGPVDLHGLGLWYRHGKDLVYYDGCGRRLQTIAWAIVGGESGPGARPCDVGWIREIVRQCRKAGVACFVKQLGAQPVDAPTNWNAWRAVGAAMVEKDSTVGQVVLDDPKGGDPAEWPADLRVMEFPK